MLSKIRLTEAFLVCALLGLSDDVSLSADYLEWNLYNESDKPFCTFDKTPPDGTSFLFIASYTRNCWDYFMVHFEELNL